MFSTLHLIRGSLSFLTRIELTLNTTRLRFMTTMPPPVFTQLDSAVVQRSGIRKDSEADDWDSFVAASTGFNPSQLHKRELGHRLDEFQGKRVV